MVQGLNPGSGKTIISYCEMSRLSLSVCLVKGIIFLGCEADHSPPCSAEVEEGVQLYHCFHFRPSLHIQGELNPYLVYTYSCLPFIE
jgi:hypothetical protein